MLWIRIRRICKFLGLPDHDPSLFVRIWILTSSSRTVRKNLIYTILWLLHDFLSLKTDVNVPSKSNKKKNFWKENLFFVWHFKSHWRKKQDPNPDRELDPYQNVTDPQQRHRYSFRQNINEFFSADVKAVKQLKQVRLRPFLCEGIWKLDGGVDLHTAREADLSHRVLPPGSRRHFQSLPRGEQFFSFFPL